MYNGGNDGDDGYLYGAGGRGEMTLAWRVKKMCSVSSSW